MKRLFAMLALLLPFGAACATGATAAAAATAATLPYDEKADAGTDLKLALLQAKSSNRKVLLVFGANWCPDCRELDKALHGKSAALIDGKFIVVKVDVGQFNKNLDLARFYGNPIRKGIPAAVLLTADNTVLYASKGGELSDARRMGDNGVYDFFNRVLNQR